MSSACRRASRPRIRSLEGGVALLVLALAQTACGDTVTLGRAPEEQAPPPVAEPPPLPRFTNIVRREELTTEGENDNPTLTADLLDIYFTSDRGGGPGGTDVWHASRTRVDEPFGAPEVVLAVSTEKFETSPAISLDGQRLWVGSEREGGQGALDIWVSEKSATGEWSAATVIPELSSPEKDIPRPLGLSGTIMPLSSQRSSPGVYRTFFARYEGGVFGTPELVTELVLEAGGTVDGFLTDDGKMFFFTLSLSDDNGDLYVARRASTDVSFGPPEPLTDLNTDADERDPWLSPDGTRLFFASDRNSPRGIYEASVVR